MEFLTLTREVGQFKVKVDQQFSQIIYDGLWYSPLRPAIDAFINEAQEVVTGKVRVKLFKGNNQFVERQSPISMYKEALAKYEYGDIIAHNAADDLIQLCSILTDILAL